MLVISTTFDKPSVERINRLWETVFSQTSLLSKFTDPTPHVSLLMGDFQDGTLLEPLLRDIAKQHRPFFIHCAGLAMFTGTDPVLYVNMVRSPALSRLHSAVWAALAGAGTDIRPHFAPQAWTPHLTIGWSGDTESMAEGVGLLADQPIDFALRLDAFTLLYEDEPEIQTRVPLDEKPSLQG